MLTISLIIHLFNCQLSVNILSIIILCDIIIYIDRRDIMRYTLMNKNNPVLEAEYNEASKGFTSIYKIININYAPLIIYKEYSENKDITSILNDWYKGRGIPSLRDDLDILLARLNISSPEALLNKAYALSLSDQYWVKPSDLDIHHEDINFFDHPFSDSSFTEITFGSHSIPSTKISLISPNNTTDGRLKKTWIIENNTRYLLKGGYKEVGLQPFNEVLATMICERLGFDHVPYKIKIVNDKIVSQCPCFINSNTELISAYQILHHSCDKTNPYEDYIRILKEHNISNPREKIENMFILDYLILNEDRHLNNFGIIRDATSLAWLDIAPIFDNGESLNILDYATDELVINGEGRFFYNIDTFDSIISTIKIKDKTRFHLESLEDLPLEFSKLLHTYQNITKMSEARITKLTYLLNSRIQKLKSFLSE